MQQCKAVLFDLDGTLIDSLALFRRSVTEAIIRHGGELSPEYFMTWHAERLSWADLLAECGINPSCEVQVQAYSKSGFNELLRTQSEWMPGAEELLQSVRAKGISSGIVTTASKSSVDAVNEKLSIINLVNVLVTAGDVGNRSKPDPYGLLLAAERLGVPPAESVYIGDQPFDVLAANAAGMASWLVLHPHTPHRAGKAATLVLRNLDEARLALTPAS